MFKVIIKIITISSPFSLRGVFIERIFLWTSNFFLRNNSVRRNRFSPDSFTYGSCQIPVGTQFFISFWASILAARQMIFCSKRGHTGSRSSPGNMPARFISTCPTPGISLHLSSPSIPLLESILKRSIRLKKERALQRDFFTRKKHAFSEKHLPRIRKYYSFATGQ